MKFTRDLCRRLLGLGGDGPVEEMEVQDGTLDLTERRKHRGSSQEALPSEEGLDEEEKTRRRAERRRAKKKRQKERRKQERGEKTEDASEQEEEVAGAVSQSDDEEEEEEEEDEWTAVHSANKSGPESFPGPERAENGSDRRELRGASDEEPEWDVSSAFVAKVASHIKLRAPRGRTTQTSRENKENEGKGGQRAEMKRRGEALTVRGIQMFGEGRYSQALDMFTEAICCDPKDHRFYGNRSFCHLRLEQHQPALADAQRSIQLAPDWPKGYFRKGCALMGLKRYSEAEQAMEQVLKLDPHCKEAPSKLLGCRLLQLRELGFEEEQSRLLLERFTTVQAAVAAAEDGTLKHPSLQDQSGSCRSLWVGNITLEVTEKHLRDLFKTFGEIESIRVLHERFCAFINFRNANMAARALERLQGVELAGSRLVMRYPDRWIQRPLPPVQRSSLDAAGAQQSSAAAGSRRCAPIDGDKCFYWQTSGCFYGDKCRFKHIPGQQGRDGKP